MKFVTILFSAALAFAHQGVDHGAEGKAPDAIDEGTAEILAEIGSEYESKIQPIFQRACFDCHSSSTNFPWYYKLPGVKQLIDADIAEAKEHLDMSKGFPFQGHGTPTEDLEAIIDSIKEGDMPPLKYKVMHWNSRLSDADKAAIKDWAGNSLIFL